jgi:hypothetical protein
VASRLLSVGPERQLLERPRRSTRYL